MAGELFLEVGIDTEEFGLVRRKSEKDAPFYDNEGGLRGDEWVFTFL